MNKMYWFIADYGIVEIIWTWNEIERRAIRYAEDEEYKEMRKNE